MIDGFMASENTKYKLDNTHFKGNIILDLLLYIKTVIFACLDYCGFESQWLREGD